MNYQFHTILVILNWELILIRVKKVKQEVRREVKEERIDFQSLEARSKHIQKESAKSFCFFDSSKNLLKSP
jgi:hypothetical protein